MLQNILNLEGVTVLNKKQQESLSGGYQTCKFTIVSGGSRKVHYIDGYTEGPAGSSEANADCAAVASSWADRCFYNCSYDGYDQ